MTHNIQSKMALEKRPHSTDYCAEAQKKIDWKDCKIETFPFLRNRFWTHLFLLWWVFRQAKNGTYARFQVPLLIVCSTFFHSKCTYRARLFNFVVPGQWEVRTWQVYGRLQERDIYGPAWFSASVGVGAARCFVFQPCSALKRKTL